MHVLDNIKLAIIMRRADNDDKAHCRHRGLVLSLGKPPGGVADSVLLILTGSVAKSLERVFQH